MGAPEAFTKREYDAALVQFERFWPGRSGVQALLHPIFLYQFGETTFAIHEAFHRALGFEPERGDATVGDVMAVTDYAGPGQHRVMLVKPIEAR